MATENLMCEIPSLDVVDAFEATPFQNTQAIEWMHAASPRFGHSNDLLKLMEGTEEEQRDYLKGLLASCIAMFCFFAVWLVFLLIFRCMGPYECGILSGKPKPLPPRPWNPRALMEWESAFSRANRSLMLLRLIVFSSGIAIIISAMLMSANGVSSLTQSLDNGVETLSNSKDLANEAISLIDKVTNQNQITADVVDTLLVDINDICPILRPSGLCTDLNDISTCNFEGIFGDNIVETTLTYFKESESNIYYQELINTRQDLVDFLGLASSLDENAQTFNWALYCAMVGSLLLAALCLLIMFALACRNSSILNALQHWFLVPAFACLVVLSFVFSMLFVIGSMALADLCIDSPDTRIMRILERFQEQLSPLGVEIASFYINECPPDEFPQEFSTQIDFVLQTIPTLKIFANSIQESAGAIQVVCGSNPSRLAFIAESTNQQLCEIVDILDAIRIFFQCKNWFPLYESAMYDAICYNGTDGFAWVATTQFVIVFFSCVLLTFRAAFYDVQVENDRDKIDGTDDESLSPRNWYKRANPQENVVVAFSPQGRRSF